LCSQFLSVLLLLYFYILLRFYPIFKNSFAPARPLINLIQNTRLRSFKVYPCYIIPSLLSM